MEMIKKVFDRYEINFDKLENYGFKMENNNYTYRKKIMDNMFEIIIKIDKIGFIEGNIYDLLVQEEYNINVELMQGEFVNKIRNMYQEILLDIRNNCFTFKYFKSLQARRINDYIISTYGDKPLFLWEKYPDFGVFKNKNNKWYAIIMNINRNKIVGKLEDEIDVINIKVDSCDLENILKNKGFYQAYHMNKKYWVSIILDDTVNDDIIFKYIDKSYQLVGSKL